jgi:hypothetical protein
LLIRARLPNGADEGNETVISSLQNAIRLSDFNKETVWGELIVAGAASIEVRDPNVTKQVIETISACLDSASATL